MVARPRRPTLEEVNLAIDAFIATRMPDARPLDDAPWIERIEERAALRYPPSFRALATRFAFEPFRVGGIWVFGNRGEGKPDDFDVAPLADRILSRCLFAHGFLPIGRPDPTSLDPIAFEVRAGGASVESPLVHLDRRRAIKHDEIKIVRRIAPSFLALLE